MDIGIIGGADGPTAVFTAVSPGGIAILVILAAALTGALAWLLLRRH